MGLSHRFVSGKSSLRTRSALLAICAGIGLSAPTFAATYNYGVDGTSGDWTTAANWATASSATAAATTGTLPGASDQASASTGVTVTVSTSVGPINELRFANNTPGANVNKLNGTQYTATGTANLTITSNGALNIQSTNGTANGNCIMGNSPGASGTLTINGGSLTLGGNVAQTTENPGSAIDSLFIGDSSSSNTVQGPTANFVMTDGTVSVANDMINGYGATLNTDGKTSDIARGYTTQTGGGITVGGAIIIGSKGLGTYTMSGGTLTETGTNGDGNSIGRDAFYLGQQNTTAASGQTGTTGAQGTFTQSGTAVVSLSNGMYIANQSNTTGTYTISGGSLTVAGDISVGAAMGAGVFTAAPVAASNNAGRFEVDGNAAATITANHMDASTANSTLAFDIGSSAGTSLIDLTPAVVGGVSYDGSAQLSTSTLVDIDPVGGFVPSPGDVYTLITAPVISGIPTLMMDGDAFDNSALSIITNTDGTESLIDTVSAVPEPTSLALVGLVSALSLRRRRV
ncbi:MAG TPA: PEP-CTERM sorting domain-containing protein [Tepidisphaeraceae bacterium]|jgi:hypothetical protein